MTPKLMGLFIAAASLFEHGAMVAADLRSELKIDSMPMPTASGVAISYREVVKRVRQGVVTVRVQTWDSKAGKESQRSGETPQAGLGSGIVLTKEGLILTNAHVVAGAQRISIRQITALNEVAASIIGRDESTDVALLQAARGDWLPVTVGDSKTVEPGDVVLAVGSPFGLEGSVTMGVISATGRGDLSDVGSALQDYLQTDAAIHPGNSGGPLVDGLGRVIGMNSAAYYSESIGLAIPMHVAVKVANDLLEFGRVQRGFLGVRMSDLDERVIHLLGLAPGARGVTITEVTTGGAAAQAGLLPGDTVVRVGGRDVTSAASLRMRLGSMMPGDTVPFTLVRQNKHLEIQITLVTSPDAGTVKAGAEFELMPGLRVTEIDQRLRDQLLLPNHFNGLRVTHDFANLADGKKRLCAGDLILRINGSVMESPMRLSSILALQRHPAPVMMLLVLRDGTEHTIGLPRVLENTNPNKSPQ